MGHLRSNFQPEQKSGNEIEKPLIDKIAARGSFIFVKGGSLLEATKEMGIEVRAE